MPMSYSSGFRPTPLAGTDRHLLEGTGHEAEQQRQERLDGHQHAIDVRHHTRCGRLRCCHSTIAVKIDSVQAQ